MFYTDGQDLRLGDTVVLNTGAIGVVVSSIDDDKYSVEYPKKNWSYLTKGALILFEDPGVAHFVELGDEVTLLCRK